MNTIIGLTFSNCNIKTQDRLNSFLKCTPSPSSLSKKYDFVFAQGTRGPAAGCCGTGGGGGGGQGGEADCSGEEDVDSVDRGVGGGDAVGDGDGDDYGDGDEDSYDSDDVWNKGLFQNNYGD